MSAQLGQRLSRVSESVTLKLNALVQKLKAEGQDVINLTAGEPDFSVPEESKTAIQKALGENRSKYTPAPGVPPLREAVAEKTNRQQPSSNWKASNVVVSNGGKHALFNALMVLLDDGDEVLIPSPYWLSYPEMVKIMGGVPRVVPTTRENGYRMSPDQLRAAITPKTKILILNSPNNPTGRMYSREDFEAIGKVLEDFPSLWVISDEIYDLINFGEVPFCSFLAAAPTLRNRCITVNGMSKSAAMTGWRIGWSVGSDEFTKTVIKLQGQCTSGINALAQWASIAALKLPNEYYEKQSQIFLKRRDIVLEILSKSAKIKVSRPQGALYAFVGIKDCLDKGGDAVGFSERLLEQAKVAVVPGVPFGDPESVRMSFATDERSLQEGCERILEFIS